MSKTHTYYILFSAKQQQNTYVLFVYGSKAAKTRTYYVVWGAKSETQKNHKKKTHFEYIRVFKACCQHEPKNTYVFLACLYVKVLKYIRVIAFLC